MRIDYKTLFKIASLLILTCAGVTFVAWRLQSEPRITGLGFRYSAGDAAHAVLKAVDEKRFGDVRVEPDAVIFVSNDGLRISDTTTIYGLAGRNHPNIQMDVFTGGGDLSKVPAQWKWFYRPSHAGRVTLHCAVYGPGQILDFAYDMDTEVRTEFGLTSKTESIVKAISAGLAVLACVLGILKAVKPTTEKPA
jgi:hypothetical protein